MDHGTPFAYLYDGSYAGFLTCIYESYVRKELPVSFSTPEDPRISLYPERAVETEEAHAGRVYRSLSQRISLDAQRMVTRGFLTCMPEKEERIYAFVRLGYRIGPAVVRDLTDPRVAPLVTALTHLKGEAHQLQGFLRFSEQGGVLTAEIEPKNRVLPLLRPHFCARYSGERFVIYDRTHREAVLPAGAVGHCTAGGVLCRRAGGDGAGLPQAMAAVLRYRLHRGTLSSQVPYDPYAQTLLEHHDRVPD